MIPVPYITSDHPFPYLPYSYLTHLHFILLISTAYSCHALLQSSWLEITFGHLMFRILLKQWTVYKCL
jgi:hypothetical protein